MEGSPRPVDQARRKAISTILYGSLALIVTAAGIYALSPKPTSDDSPKSGSSSTDTVTTSSASSQPPVQSAAPSEIGVRVVYFGMPLAATGVKKETVELDSPAFLSNLQGALTELHPSLKSMLPSMVFLVDGVSATGDVQLENDVEVDILAVMAGG